MESQIENWRCKATEISASAGILAGGDGSARKKKGVINGAYGWGVYGIGEPTVESGRTRRRRTFNHVLRRKRGLGHGIGTK
jgi:hypothetical protein